MKNTCLLITFSILFTFLIGCSSNDKNVHKAESDGPIISSIEVDDLMSATVSFDGVSDEKTIVLISEYWENGILINETIMHEMADHNGTGSFVLSCNFLSHTISWTLNDAETIRVDCMETDTGSLYYSFFVPSAPYPFPEGGLVLACVGHNSNVYISPISCEDLNSDLSFLSRYESASLIRLVLTS